VCDKTCIFFFFPIINKYFLMAKRSLLSRCPSYVGSMGSDEWNLANEGNVYVRNLSILNQTENYFVLYFGVFSLSV